MKKQIKLAIIGCDTSHCVAFTRLLHSPEGTRFGAEAKVIAAWAGGSTRVDPDGARLRRFTGELLELGVPLMDSPEAAVADADAVMLLSADGSLHRDEFLRTLKPGRPVFIDKPLAWNSVDVDAILGRAAAEGVPVASASSLRFSRVLEKTLSSVDNIAGADVYVPGTLLGDQGMFYYAIHGVEILYRIMGPGCISVDACSEPGGDYVVGHWSGGRKGWLRAARSENKQFGALIHGVKTTSSALNLTAIDELIYIPLLEQVIPFLCGGDFPVASTEMAEVIRFIEACHVSRESGVRQQLGEPLNNKY
jgi:hypothetical protein